MSKKSIFIIVSLMIIVVYFFTLGDDLSLNNNIELKTNKQEESSKSINIVANTEQPKSISKKEEVISKETTTPSWSGYSTEQFTISLTTDKTLVFPMTTESEFAIPFIGQLESNSKVSDFAISLSEKYMNYADFIKLEVIDQSTGKQAQCDIGFIGSLEKDTNYHIKLNYSEDYLGCSLVSSQRMSAQTLAMKKKMSKPIKLSDLPEELQKKFLNQMNTTK